MISIIAAIGKNNELGFDNKLLWDIKEDMKYFREITTGKTVVMGYNTYKSIGMPLPKRENIVISRTPIDGNYMVMSFDHILRRYEFSEDEIFIIGGAKIYNNFLEYAKKLYITHIYDEKTADAYFPQFDENDYNVISSKNGLSEEIDYTFKVYKRKK